MDALKSIKFLADLNSGHFRAKIWHWIKYTTVKASKLKGEDGSKKRWAVVHVQGFIQTISNLLSAKGNYELNMLAARTII